MIEIIIPGLPIPWKAPFVSTRGSYSPRGPIKEQFRNVARAQYKLCALECAVAVDMDFYMPIPKSTSKKKMAQMLNGELRPITRPDRGNLLKLYEDVLTGIVIKDDSQIVDGAARKFYGVEPKTIIRIYKCEEYKSGIINE